MVMPAEPKYDPFAEALRESREALEREAAEAARPHPGGRPPTDKRRGKVVTVYLRADILEWAQEEIALNHAENVSQVLVAALRSVMRQQKRAEAAKGGQAVPREA